MYIHIQGPQQLCSRCGSIDHTEIVTRSIFNGEERIIRCTDCGHEKVLSTTKWTSPEENLRIYELKNTPKIVEF
jgi:hypothetical protein